MRLLNVWDQLAERYCRPLDEDDIIDLSTGSLYKDRGVLRNANRVYEMGMFADDDPGSDVDGNVSDADAQTDGEDELNFLAQADLSDELDREKEKLNVPPVWEMDPADAEDLREFMEAERTRKELYGTEEDEDEADGFLGRARSHLDTASQYTGEEDEEEDYFEDFESGSDDEFAAWDIDDQKIRPVLVQSSRPATPEDIIDLTRSPSPSPSHAPDYSVPGSREQSPERLSYSPPPPSPDYRTSTIRNKSRTSGRHSPHNVPVRQLATPPQSSSSVCEDYQDFTHIARPASPDYADLTLSSHRASTSTVKRVCSTVSTASLATVKQVSKSRRLSVSSVDQIPTQRLSKRSPESHSESDDHFTANQVNSRRKGKEKATSIPDDSEDYATYSEKHVYPRTPSRKSNKRRHSARSLQSNSPIASNYGSDPSPLEISDISSVQRKEKRKSRLHGTSHYSTVEESCKLYVLTCCALFLMCVRR